MARLILRRTCTSHPEQYDAYKGEERVAYFRLRHGRFTVSMPHAGDPAIFESYPEGDGEFTDEERDTELAAGCKAVLRKLGLRPNKEVFVIEVAK